METVGPLSPLALIASFGYIAACMAAFAAAFANHRKAGVSRGDRSFSTRQTQAWIAVGCSFILFFALRVAQVEDRLRSSARGLLSHEHGYSKRWDLQAPAAALLVLLISAVLLVTWLRWVQRKANRTSFPFALWLAIGAVGAMAVLIMLRLVSLHAIDSVLYRGPRLNWIVDTGSTLVVVLTGISTAFRRPRARRKLKPPHRW